MQLQHVFHHVHDDHDDLTLSYKRMLIASAVVIPVVDPEGHVRGMTKGVCPVWNAVDTSPDIGC